MPLTTEGIMWNYTRDATDYRRNQTKLRARRHWLQKKSSEIKRVMPLTTAGIKWNYACDATGYRRNQTQYNTRDDADYRRNQVKLRSGCHWPQQESSEIAHAMPLTTEGIKLNITRAMMPTIEEIKWNYARDVTD